MDARAGFTILGERQHAAWGERVLPPVESLVTGLWSVPVPIPHNPLRYTLCYLVPCDEGLVVVDPGWEHEEGWSALTAGLAAAGASTSDVAGIVVTHIHHDHHGLSARLQEASGAWIAMHPAERETLPQRTGERSLADRSRGVERWLTSGGAPEQAVAELLEPLRARAGDESTAMAEPDVLLEDGDLVPVTGRRLRAVWTPGHTPGHLCLAEPDASLLLTGDHVLPRITPNIGLAPETERPALAEFLASLRRTAGYDDHDALPAHEYRFRGLAARSGDLIDHHERRCAELVALVERLGEPTLWELAEGMTWSRPWPEVGAMRFAALAETTAHAGYLVSTGALEWAAPGVQPIRIRLAADR